MQSRTAAWLASKRLWFVPRVRSLAPAVHAAIVTTVWCGCVHQAIAASRKKAGYTGKGTADVVIAEDEDDFLATLTGTNMTYLAPERLNFESAATTSDVWAFGCLAYEICTGKRPWLQLKTMDEIIRGVPRRHHPLIVPLLKHTLQRNPARRSSAKQILRCVYTVLG